MESQVLCGDNLELMRAMPDRCVDLIFTSPPYEAARTYGIDFKLRGQDWVDWCIPRYLECLRVCRGLVAWVIEGQTRNYQWSATPALLMADLHRAGVHLRKPPAFARVGIPGSGGPDFLRNDWEWIVCAGPGGKLPWSDNTAMGHPPKWAPGGAMSNRHADGQRINSNLSAKSRYNQWGKVGSKKGMGTRRADGSFCKSERPSHVLTFAEKVEAGAKVHTKHDTGADMRLQAYLPPCRANPGNIIRCVVGGGVMGSKLCHENEAPFPESLAEFFIRSFCQPSGTVLDPFCGSGTTLAVAMKHFRHGIGIDVRESQVELTRRRLAEVQASHPLSGFDI